MTQHSNDGFPISGPSLSFVFCLLALSLTTSKMIKNIGILVSMLLAFHINAGVADFEDCEDLTNWREIRQCRAKECGYDQDPNACASCSVHSWHLNFSPQIASVQTLKCPSAIASRAFESLHWCNFGEKFKCHSCDETISIKSSNAIRVTEQFLLKLLKIIKNKTKYFCSDSMMKYALREGLERAERAKKEIRES